MNSRYVQRRKSVMKAGKRFSTLPHVTHQRSSFDLSYGYKTTFDSGYLIPFFFKEVLPGDTWKVSCTNFARLATLIVPYMDNAFLETMFFFVPNRLVWDHWQNFCGERIKPTDSTDYLIPTTTTTNGFEVQSLADYFGLPSGVKNLTVSALPFRAYNLIWNEWIRDQNLQDPVEVKTDDGPDDHGQLYKLLRRGKRHDYFTSCLPWPQKGPGVELPLAGSADVISNDQQPNLSALDGAGFKDQGIFTHTGGADSGYLSIGENGKLINVKFGGQSGLKVDLSTATAATINSLRQAIALQQYFEIDARGGTRYTEKLQSHFGVVSPDSRLQRPEYLGGSSTPINTCSVPQTSATSDVTPQANLSAYGIASRRGHGFVRSFVEHGMIIGLVNVRVDLTYQYGIERYWSRRTNEDFYWPSFAHLGEQAVLNKEIYAQGIDADNDVFGYQERYAEYRYSPSLITGKFRSSFNEGKDTRLDVWHLAQKFSNLPVLSDQFIQDQPDFKRVIAVQDEPEFLLDTMHNIICARVMPVYGTPGLRRL